MNRVQGANIPRVAEVLAQDGSSSRDLVEQCLEAIADPRGEGGRAFPAVSPESARRSADAADRLRADGRSPSPFAGIPVSIKDLFDVEGEVTAAGSRLLASAAPASADAAVVGQLKAAGFIPIGRTHMTELALSAMGTNPFHAMPLNPYDRSEGRVPGGSSSGAAVSVTDGMAWCALASDTGGSTRLPAALCGAVGFKSSFGRIETRGLLPLSRSLDSIGVITRSVACATVLDAVLTGQDFAPTTMPWVDATAATLGFPSPQAMNNSDLQTASAFEAAIAALSASGFRIVEIDLPELDEMRTVTRSGSLALIEAARHHARALATTPELLSEMTRESLVRGLRISDQDFGQLLAERRRLTESFSERVLAVDALVMPTSPIIAPAVKEVAEPEGFFSNHRLLLQNAVIANFFGGCSISIPCHRPGDAPVGLMLTGSGGADRALLSLAARAEAALAPLRAI